MKSLLLLGLLLSLACPLASQDTLWSRVYGGVENDFPFPVACASDSGFLVAGTTYSYGIGTPDEANFWLFRVDVNGDSSWSRAFGGHNGEHCSSFAPVSGGGWVLGGNVESDSSGVDMMLLRVNAEGDSLWTAVHAWSGDQFCWSVRQTMDGGYVMTGKTDRAGTQWADMCMIKADSLGNMVWTRVYGLVEGDEWGIDVRQMSDGGYAVLAGYNDTSQQDPLSARYWLVRTNEAGDSIWSHHYGGTTYDQPQSLDLTEDGGFVLAGTRSALDAAGDFWVVRTDANGDTLWTGAYGGTNRDGCSIVRRTPDNGFLLAGYTYSFGAVGDDFLIVKIDSVGALEWSRHYGRSQWDECYGACVTSSGDFALAGWTYTAGTGYDLWLMKIDPTLPQSSARPPEAVVSNETVLYPSYPNPFNSSSTLSYDLPEAAHVSLTLFDLEGRQVRSLADSFQPAGRHTIPLDATGLASGLYFCRLSAGTYSTSQKVMVVK